MPVCRAIVEGMRERGREREREKGRERERESYRRHLQRIMAVVDAFEKFL